MNAFITVSRAYGTPTLKSEVDLVIRVDEKTAEKLTDLGENGKIPVRFGNLNLILCTTDEEFAAWQVGTKHLEMQRQPTSRQEAMTVFNTIRSMLNIEDRGDSRR